MGICCIEGDSGAPLDDNEAEILDKIYPEVLPYLREKGVQSIEKYGKHMIDSDGDVVTPLINNKECAYVIFDNKIATCAIEKAYFDGKVPFRKPISCHMYPVRLKEYEEFTAVNYHHWDVCEVARNLGKKESVPVYRFLKDSLIRKFGEEWYEQLVAAAEFIKSSKK